MKRKTLLLCTHDDRIWERLQPLQKHWALRRCSHFDEIQGAVGDVLWIDRDLAGAPPLDTNAWRSILDKTKAILASPSPNDEEGLLAFNSGFVGYLHLYSPQVQVIQSIKVILQGNLWVGQSLLSRLLRKTGVLLNGIHPTTNETWTAGLTERECEVARRVAQGESNHDIAVACGITERTVKAHLTATFEKLGVEDRLQLTLRVHGIR